MPNVIDDQPTAKQIKEWTRDYRRSLRRVRPSLQVLTLVVAVLAGAYFGLGAKLWACLLIVAIPALSTLGDVFNVIYLGRRLREAKGGEDATPEAG